MILRIYMRARLTWHWLKEAVDCPQSSLMDETALPGSVDSASLC